eukprot:g7508.t1
MSAAVIYDCGRDTFLERSSSKPPSKYDSIEYLETASCWKGKKNSSSGSKKTTLLAAGGPNNAAASTCGSDASNPSSNATTVGAWSWADGNNSRATEVTHAASSWKEEVSGKRRSKPSTAPSAASSSCKHRKKFYWGPRVNHQGQETDRDVRTTNMGEPVTFALALDKCPSTVSTLRSLVPRRFHSTASTSTHDDDSTTLIAGLAPFIRTSITDRVHDGIYDTDTAHKSTLGGRVKRGEIRSPDICQRGKRFGEAPAAAGRHQFKGPAYYDTSTGFDAISRSSTCLPFPRDECKYDSYIRRGLGQTTGSEIGPGYYGWRTATTAAPGQLEFSNLDRWPPQPTSKMTPNRGPWDDVKEAWGRGGYIETAVPRDCNSYLPKEVLWYMNHLDLDHLGKECFETAMRRHPKRYAACFSKTQEPDWRVIGDPARGPGTYAIERAEPLTFPAPQGGSGDADPTRPSLPFRVRYTPFDTRHLAAGYKTLKPRFSTPRAALYASELSGGVQKATAGVTGARLAATAVSVDEKTAGTLVEPRNERRRRLTPAAKAKAVTAEAAADPWRVGGRGSRFVRLERPSVLDPIRDGSRRRAAAATWSSSHRSWGPR